MKQVESHCTKQDQQRSLTSTIRNNTSSIKKIFSSITLITIIIISLIFSIPIIGLGVVLTLSQPVHSTKQQQQHLSPISWFTKMLSPTKEKEIVTESMMESTESTTEAVSDSDSETFNIQFDPSKTGNVHIIILVHGIFGNSKELNYLEKMIHENVVSKNNNIKQSDDDHWIIHSVTSNVGITLDGIAAGGHRIATEVNNLLTTVQTEYTKFLTTTITTGSNNNNNKDNKITLSIVGHSLGGLYSRYAISEIDFTNNKNIVPAVFCTIACPHLGVSDYTYIKLPRFLEGVVATGLQQTGNDLFRYSTLLDTMITDKQFIQPLQNFYHRRAYANAYNTDLQVPFRTSAFLSNTDSIHYYRTTITNETTATTTTKSTTSDEKDETINNNKFVALVVETKKRILDDIQSNSRDVATATAADAAVCNDETVNDNGEHQQTSSTTTSTTTPVDVTTTTGSSSSKLTGDEIAIRLDSFGWTKIFCDMRETVTSIPKPISMYQSMSQFSTQCYNLLQAPLQSSTRTVVKESKSALAVSTSAKPQSSTNDVVNSSSEDIQKQQQQDEITAVQEQQTTAATKASAMMQKDSYTASELIQQYSDCNDRWHLPYGHSTIVANSKAEWYAELNAAGRPMVKRIAQDLLNVIPQAVVEN